MSGLEWLGLALAVFISTATLDFAWVHCVGAVADRRALRAGLWSGSIVAISLVGLLGVTRVSVWLALPEVAGAVAGAASGVWWRNRC